MIMYLISASSSKSGLPAQEDNSDKKMLRASAPNTGDARSTELWAPPCSWDDMATAESSFSNFMAATVRA
jgi:hypothetical protein